MGLGHATRTITVINGYKKDYDITVVSYENTLEYLKKELGKEITFISLKDYPKLERGKGLKFYFYIVLDLLTTGLIIEKEKRKVREIGRDYDFIFSDGRYGFCSKSVPSFILSHQIAFIAPKFLSKFMFLTDLSNYLYFKNFDKLFIPDFEKYDLSLARKLSHPEFVKHLNHEYIGVWS